MTYPVGQKDSVGGTTSVMRSDQQYEANGCSWHSDVVDGGDSITYFGGDSRHVASSTLFSSVRISWEGRTCEMGDQEVATFTCFSCGGV